MRAARLTSTSLVLAALLASCGGDDGTTGRAEGAQASATVVATPGSPFLSHAEAICRDANEKEAALGAPGIDWIHSEHFTDLDFLVEFHAIGRSALRDLRELSPPAEDRERYSEALRAIAQMLRGLDEQITAVRDGRGGATDAIAVYEKGYIDLAAVGGVLGFTECLGIVL